MRHLVALCLFVLWLPSTQAAVTVAEAAPDLAAGGWRPGDEIAAWRAQGSAWQTVDAVADLWPALVQAERLTVVEWRLLDGRVLSSSARHRDFLLRLRCAQDDADCQAVQSLSSALQRESAGIEVSEAYRALAQRFSDPEQRALALWQALHWLPPEAAHREPVQQLLMQWLGDIPSKSTATGLLLRSLLHRSYVSGQRKPTFLVDAAVQAANALQAEDPALALALRSVLLVGTDAELAAASWPWIESRCAGVGWNALLCAEALALAGLARVAEQDFSTARTHCAKAEALASSDPDWVAVSVMAAECLAWLEVRSGAFAEAERRVRDALARLKDASISWLQKLALEKLLVTALGNQGLLEEAENLARATLAQIGDRLPAERLSVLSNLGVLICDLGRNEEAIGLFREVVEQGGEGITARVGQLNLSRELLQLDRIAEATPHIQALARWNASPQGHPGMRAAILEQEGMLALALGEWEPAEARLREALLLRDRPESQDWRLATLRADLAALLLRQGRGQEALSQARAAATLMDEQVKRLRPDELLRLSFRSRFDKVYRLWIRLEWQTQGAAEGYQALQHYRWQSLRRLAGREWPQDPPESAAAPGLSEDESVLAFLRLEQGWLVFLRTQAGTQAQMLPGDPALIEAKLAAWQRQLRFPPDPARNALEGTLARELHALLIAPIQPLLGNSQRWWLQLDGSLQWIPFAALATGERCGNRPCRLVDKVALADVLGEPARRVRTNLRPQRILAVGAPNPAPEALPEWLVQRQQGGQLPGAIAETQLIQRRFGQQRVLALTGPQATEARLRNALADADLIHLATHAVADRTRPFAAYLPLSLGDGGSGNDDGRLSAMEMLGLRTPAALVVLAGCETAIGPSSQSEGMLSLRYAFHAAGATTVAATLWRISDQATAELFEDFYAAVQAEGDAMGALQSAQRAALDAGGQRAHPYVWAGLTLSTW